jgi:hypothetical protein
MPAKEEILNGLIAAANQHNYSAIAWHIIIYALLAALFAGWKPTNRFMIFFAAVLMLSASVFATLQKNIFNTVIFCLLAAVSLFYASKGNENKIAGDRSWPDIAGLLLVFFGLIYPEFLNAASAVEYAYASPVGLIPCPTLCVVIGFALLYKNFLSRSWGTCMAAAGMLYGLTGVFYLGVKMDFFLLAGALLLAVNLFMSAKNEGKLQKQN